MMTTVLDLNNRGVLLVSGADTVRFLQGQVTCDIAQLSIDSTHGQLHSQTNLGAHCNPKGRMIFSFRACQLNDDTIALVFHKSLTEIAFNALKKYSVFSKVALSDASDKFHIIGLYQQQLKELTHLFAEIPDIVNSATHITINEKKGVLIKIDNERYEAWLHKDTTMDNLNFYQSDQQWDYENILAGIGEVRAETTEQFIPQMLNLQILANGISFKKGCYTGQEIVARMAYLGKLKKRMYRLESPVTSTKLNPNSAIYSDSKVVGQVVFSSIQADKQHCLAVINNESAIDSDNKKFLSMDLDNHQKITLQTLPYAITK